MPNARANKKLKQPPILFAKTQKLIRQIESRLDGPLVTYWNNPRGSICNDDVVAFFEVLERIGDAKKIYLFLKSDGGNGQASLRIVNLVRGHCKHLTAMVPLDCASAATMIALGANEIKMGPMSYLTAVDTSLTHDLSPLDRDNDRVSVSLDELLRVLRLWKSEGASSDTNPYKELYQYVHPLVIGAIDRASSLSVMLCQELLACHMTDKKKIQQIAVTLNSKYPSHDYPILPAEARKIGLSVSRMDGEMNALLLELNRLYSEMGQKATTDFDEAHAHSNEIINILEVRGLQLHFKQDKDWFYRGEERRWLTLNDHSGWRRIEKVKGRLTSSVVHIS